MAVSAKKHSDHHPDTKFRHFHRPVRALGREGGRAEDGLFPAKSDRELSKATVGGIHSSRCPEGPAALPGLAA